MKNKLRIIKLFLVFVIPFFLFQNCSEDEVVEGKVETTLEDDPVVNKLLEMGYELERIQELDDFYLVQGDLLFSKNIEDYNQKGKNKQSDILERHAHTDNLVSQTNVTSMTVYIDSSVSVPGADNWQIAVTDAIDDLNSISNSKLNFIVSTNSDSDIIVKSDNNALPSNTIAAAGFPTNDQPYNTILINLDFLPNIDISDGIKRYNMVHELGHCIGLRHTNWETNDPYTTVGANLIPGTPSQDPNSVMNGGTALDSWSGFSVYDIVSIEYLYPIPTISGTNLICNTETETYTLVGASSATWQVSSNLQTISSTGTSITVSPLNALFSGSAYVAATINGNTVQKDFYIGKPSLAQLMTNSGVPYDVFNLPAGCENGNTYWEFNTRNALDQVSEFQFSVSGGTPIIKTAINGSAILTAQELGILEGQTLSVTVRPVNSCGSQGLVLVITLYRPTDCECGIGVGCALP
ncbi:M57 family metalloprotease [Flavivirga jejuensis]|uniref:M57 family metalloprotease n=1 Tax=Flavivirga jejuensis TaxID=870487 RepID=A0ABT8WI79_9FLAO|nr:M57 family metalloprotease [Flavivirga jejuensis]MDO5972841.1 M57 family metalloprotease [Flavivirga jejuensis]